MRGFTIGFSAFIVLIIVFVLYSRISSQSQAYPTENLNVTSTAFEAGGMIPVKYSGRGEDLSPPLKLGDVVPEAKSIAIIMDDLDHPIGIYNHWVIWDIPADIKEIPEGVARETTVAALGNAVQGKSAYGGKHYYRGPLPPVGSHKYIFRVYVLDTILDLDSDANKSKLLKAMEGHILQYGTLLGEFGSEKE